jgi:hypothetical protein
MVDLQDVEPERRADVAIDAITVERRRWQRENRRPGALSAREALAALEFEALLVWTAAQNLATGMELDDADRGRLQLAMRRIDSIVGEVLG